MTGRKVEAFVVPAGGQGHGISLSPHHVARRITFGAVSWGVLIACAGSAFANPADPTVRAGSVAFNKPDAKTLEIKQSTSKAVIDWRSFSIDKGETTKFIQPGSNAVVLNRVTGNESSQLLGNMTANGQVFLINRNGVVIGKDARIDVGSLVVTTADIKNKDFLNEKYTFDGKATAEATVINKGTITVADRGLAALVAPSVKNEGTIRAKVGQVVMGGAQSFTLDPHGDGLFSFEITKASPATGALVQNAGKIVAEGGNVLLSARAAESVVDSLIENTGVIEARSAKRQGGKIVLDAGDGSETGSGTVSVAGRVDAGGTTGGEVTIQGKAVEVAAAATVRADGTAGNGGTVRMTAADAVKVAGKVTATGASRPGKAAKGGTVVATAEKVTLDATAKVDVSGSTGGGTALIGGNEKGNGPERNARATRVEKGATIKADAVRSGDGGKVVVWADGTTAYGGSISAKGGAKSGNGGFAEVSGKQNLVYRGTADLTAPKGSLGTLLLDPDSITVQAAGANDAELPDILETDGGAATFTISAGALVSALNGANVSLAATSDINFATPVDASANPLRGDLSISVSGGTFRVQPDSAITLRGSLTVDAQFVTLFSDITTDGNQTYNTTLFRGGDNNFRTNGGNFLINGDASIDAQVAPFLVNTVGAGGADGSITVTGQIQYPRGPSILDFNAGTNTITVGGPIGTDARPFQSVTAVGSAISVGDVFTLGTQSYTGDLTLTGTQYITSEGGDFLVTGATTLAGAGATKISALSFPLGGSGPIQPGGRLSFAGPGTIDGAVGLTLTSEGNRVDVAGAIGAVTPLASLAVSGTDITTTGATTTGGQGYTGSASVSMGGDYTGTAVLVSGPTTLTANTTMVAPEGFLNFDNTVDGGGFSLSMDTGATAASTGFTRIQGAVSNVRDLTMISAGVILEAGAATTGNITLTAAGPGFLDAFAGIRLAGNYTTQGGDFTATGNTTLLSNVSVDSRGVGGADGAIAWRAPGRIFSSGPARSLTLNSGTNDIDLGVAIGQSGNPLLSLTATGANITVSNNVTTTTTQTYMGETTFGPATFDSTGFGQVRIVGNTTLSGGAATTTIFNVANGSLVFTGDVDGASALQMTSPLATIDIGGEVGSATRPASITGNAQTIVLRGANSVGSQDWTATSTGITLQGSYSTQGAGTFTLTGPTLTLSGATDITTAGGNATFSAAITGAGNDFSVDVGTGALSFGGALNSIGDLALRAASIPGLGNLVTAGSQTYTVTDPAGAFNLDGDRTTGGGAFTVNGNTNVTSGTFTINTDGGATSGAILFDGNLGQFGPGPFIGAPGGLILRSGTASSRITGFAGTAAARLALLDIAGDTIRLDGSVRTAGNQIYDGNTVTVGGAFYETSGGVISVTGATLANRAGTTAFQTSDGDITFDGPGTIDGTATVTMTAGSLSTIRGVNVGGLIGGTTPLAGLTITAQRITTNGAITNGDQSYLGGPWRGIGAYNTNGGNFNQVGGLMTLTGNVSIDSAGGTISFSDIAGTGFNFTADSDTADLTVTGALTDIGNLTLRGANVFGLAGVSTQGFQDYTATAAGGVVVLGGTMTTNGSAFTVTGDTLLRSNTTVQTTGAGTGAVTFDGDINNNTAAASLTVRSGTADTTVTGQVGTAADPISALSIDAGAIAMGGSVFTLGDQTYISASTITLSGAQYLTGTGGGFSAQGDVLLDAAGGTTEVDGDTSVVFSGTVNGPVALAATSANGGVSFFETIGGTTPLTSVTATGTGVIMFGATTSGGPITINGSWFTSGTYTTNGGALTVNGDSDVRGNLVVDTAGGNILFDGTVDESVSITANLTLNSGAGDTRITGAVDMNSADITGATIALEDSVLTRASQSYTGALTVSGANYTVQNAGDITVTGTTVIAGANSSFTTGNGDIVFAGPGTINGPGRLILTASGTSGDIRVAGAIGGTTALDSLNFVGDTITTNGAVTAGNQQYDGQWTGQGSYLTNGGIFQQTNGTLSLAAAVNITTDGGDASFGPVAGNGNNFTVDVDTGLITGSLSMTDIADLTLRANTIQGLGSVETNGFQSYTAVGATGVVILDGNRTTNGGAFTVNGQASVTANTAVDTRSAGADGAIDFNGAVTSPTGAAATLTLRAGTANVGIDGQVGTAADTLGGLVIAGNTVTLDGLVFTSGDQSYTAVNGVNLATTGGTYVTNGGDFTITGTTVLRGDTTVDSRGLSTGGNITLDGAVAQTGGTPLALTLQSGTGNARITGDVALATAGLASLTMDGGALALGGNVFTEGNQSYTAATQTTFSGATYLVRDNGGIAVTGAAQLDAAGGATTFTSRTGDVNFGGTVDGDVALTATATDGGAVVFDGVVGGTTALASLTANGVTVTTNGISTDNGAILVNGGWSAAGAYVTDGGTVTINGATTLRASTTVDTRGAGGGGAILLNGTLDSGTSGTGLTLTSGNANTRIAGIVGGTTALAGLSIDGATINLDDSVTTTGSQSYTGALTTAGATYTVTATGDLTVTGSTTVVAASSSGFINNGTGDVIFTGPGTIDGPAGVALFATGGGNVRVDGAIGGITAPRFLATGGTTITTNGVTTSGGTQSYSGNWVGSGNYITNGGIFTQSGGTLTLAGDVSIATAGGVVGFGSVIGGGNDFSVDADSGQIAGGTSITGVGNLSLRANDIGGLGDVETNGNQTYTLVGTGGFVDLDGDRTTNGGTFTINGTTLLSATAIVDTRNGAVAGNVLFDGDVVPAGGFTGTLFVRGGVAVARISGDVGSTVNPLGGLNIAANTIQLDGSVFTQNDQIYTPTVSVTFNGATYDTAAGNLSVGGPALIAGTSAFSAQAGDVRFTDTVDGPGNLTATALAGTVGFTGQVGGTTPLASLTVNGATIETVGVVTSGDQSYDGAWSGRGSYATNGGAFTQTGGGMTLAGNTQITTDNGTATFGAVAGAGNDFSVDVGTGIIDSGATIDGVRDLSLRAGSIGGFTSVVTTGDQTYTATTGTVTLDGARTTNGGDFTVNGRGLLQADTVVDTRGVSTGGNILLTGDVTAGTPSATLTLRSGAGSAEIAGTVGTAAAGVGSLTVDGGALQLGAVFTGGDQTYIAGTQATFSGAAYTVLDNGGIAVTGPAVLNAAGGATAITSRTGDVSFGDTVNGAIALTATATDGGSVAFDGVVGGTTPLASLTANGATVITNDISTAGAILITGDWSAAGAVATDGGTFTVNGDTVLRASTVVDTRTAGGIGGAILLDGAVDSGTTGTGLTLTSGDANTRIAGVVGGTTPLAGLSVTGATINLDDSVTTTGSQSYTGALTTAGATYTVTTTGDLTVTGATTVVAASSSGFLNNGTGDVVFTGPGTIDGPAGVALFANGGGSVRVAGAVGETTPLQFLAAGGATIVMNGVITAGGTQSYNGNLIAGGNYVTNGGNFTQSGGTLTLDGTASGFVVAITTNGGSVGFGAVQGDGSDFNIDADTGRITASGGGITAVSNVSMRGSDISGLGGVQGTGDQTYTLVGTGGFLDLDGDFATNGGRFTVTGNALLSANVLVDTRVGTFGGDILFDGDIVPRGGVTGTLTLRTQVDVGTTRVTGNIGSTVSPLGGLDIESDTITLDGNVVTQGQQTYAGTRINFNGATYETTAGGITVDSSLAEISGAVALTTRGGNALTINSSVDGPGSLTASALDGGTVSVTNLVGSVTPLSSFSANGATITTVGVVTNGDQTYTGAWIGSDRYETNGGAFTQTGGGMTLAGNTQIVTDNGTATFGAVTGAGNDFSVDVGTGIIDSGATIDGVRDLSLRAGSIGGFTSVVTTGDQTYTATAPTGMVTLDGARTTNGGDFTVNGRSLLQADTVVDTRGVSAAGTILLSGDVTAGTPTATLTLRSGEANTEITGTVGSAAAGIASLTIEGEDLQLGSVFTSGNQTYTAGSQIRFSGAAYTVLDEGGISVAASSTFFNAPGGAATVTSRTGDVSFGGTIEGDLALTVTAENGGSVLLSGFAGEAVPFRSLTLTGASVTTASILSVGPVVINGGWSVAGTVETLGSSLTVNGDTVLRGDVSVTTFVTGGPGGAILFNGAIDSGTTGTGLTLDSGSANTRLAGVVGGTTPLADLSVTGATINLDSSVTTAGAQSYAGALTTAGATYTVTTSGDLTVTGATTVAAPSSSGFINSGTGDVIFTGPGTIDGPAGVALFASGGGSVRVDGAIGGITAPEFLATGGTTITTNGVTTSGGTQSYAGNWVGSGAYITNGGIFTHSGDTLTLAGDVSIVTSGGVAAFRSVIGGGNDFSVDADTGIIARNGSIVGVGNLSLRANTIQGLGDVETNGDQAYTVVGTNGFLDLNGNRITNGGDFTVNGRALVSVNVLVDTRNGAAAGNILFDGNVGQVGGTTGTLTLRGGVGEARVTGDVGSTFNPLSGLDIAANTIRLDGSVFTQNDQTYTPTTSITFNGATYDTAAGNLSIGGPAFITGISAFSAQAGDVRFTGTVDGPGDLTASAPAGTVGFASQVGGTTPLASLTVNGATIETVGVITGGDQTYDGAWSGSGSYATNGGVFTQTGTMTLAGNVDIATSGGMATFDAVVGAGNDFSVDTDTGLIAGGTTIAGVRDLSLRAASIGGYASIVTTGDQTYTATTGTVTLDGERTTNGGDFTVNGVGLLQADTVVDTRGVSTAGNILLSGDVAAGTPASTLTLRSGTGSAEIAGTVGTAVAGVGGLTVDGGALQLGSVFTGGDQTYIAGTQATFSGTTYTVLDNGGIAVTGPAVLNAAGGATAFTSRTGNVSFGDTVDGAVALAATATDGGSVLFSGTVGGTTPLASLTATGDTVVTNDISTAGAILITGDWTAAGTYETDGGTFTVNGDTVLRASASVDTRTAGGAGGAILFDGTIDSGPTGTGLTLSSGDANTRLAGVVGDTTPLADLTVTGATINLDSSVTTTGAQSYTGALTTAGATYIVTTTGDLTVTGATTVVAASSSGFLNNGTGDVVFTGPGTIDGPSGVAAFANGGGNVRIDGQVGGITAPQFLATGGATITTNGVTTAGGTQSYLGNWIGSGDYITNGGIFTQSGGTLTLAGNVSVQTAGGQVDFDAVIGGGNDFSVDADTGRIAPTTGITGVGNLSLRARDIGGLGDVETTGDQTYTLVGTGGIVDLDGNRTTNGGDFTINGRSLLSADVTVNSGGGNILFNGNLLRSGSFNGSLTLQGGAGDARVAGDIGEAGFGIRALDVVANTIRMDGSVFTSTGQTYTPTTSATFSGATYDAATGNVRIAGPAIMAGTSGFTAQAGDVVFTDTVDGPGSLSATATAGTVSFNGQVGGTTPLSGFSATGATIETVGVTTDGTQVYSGDWAGSGDYVTNGGDFTVNGTTRLRGDTSVATAGGAILLDGPVIELTSAAAGLELDSGTGATRITGAIGTATTAGIQTLRINGQSIRLDGLVSTRGDQSYTAATTLFRGAGYRVLQAGNFLVTGGATIDTAGAGLFRSTGGDLTFTGAVDGTPGLNLTADGGSVRLLGQVGGTSAPAFLQATGTTIETHGVTTAAGGFQSYDGQWRPAGSYVTNGGGFTIPGQTVLIGDVSIVTGGGTASFAGTIAGGGFDLSVNAGSGLARLTGVISGVNDILVQGAQVRVTSTSTTGSQSYISTGTGATDGVYFGSTYEYTGSFLASGHIFLGDDVIVRAVGPAPATPGPVTFDGPIDAGTLTGAPVSAPPSLTVQGLAASPDSYNLTFNGVAGGASRLGFLTVENFGRVVNDTVPFADRGLIFNAAAFRNVRNVSIDGLDVSGVTPASGDPFALILENILGPARFGSFAVPSTLIGKDRVTAYKSSLLSYDSSATLFVTINGCRVGGDPFCEVSLGLTRPSILTDVLPLPPKSFINPTPFIIIQPTGGCVYSGATDCVLDPQAIATGLFGLDTFDPETERLRFLDSGNEERW